MTLGGAPAPFRPVPLFVAVLCLLLVAGCTRVRKEADQEPPSGQQAAAPAAVTQPSPRYIRVSVYVTDARTNEPIENAEVFVGQEQLLPTPLPRDYGDNPAGLYASESLEGGSYLFRVRRSGYRSVAGRLEVPPVPERIVGEDPPVVLEPEDVRESDEDAPSFRALVLWQKHKRVPAEGPEGAHAPVTKPAGPSPHRVTTHPIGAAPEQPAAPPR